MADPPTTRDIEAFLINPTFAVMDDQYQHSSMASESYLPTRPLDEMFSLAAAKKKTDSFATAYDFRSEPISWRGYASEEEVASPTDTDNMSFHSASSESEMIGSGDEYAHSEAVIETCKPVKQQCSKAQAVTLVSAGKAKVVSMPKLIDLAATSPLECTTTNTSIRPPVSRFQDASFDASSQTSSRSFESSSRSSSDKSPASTAPSSVFEQPKRSTSLGQQSNLTRPQTSAGPQSSSSPKMAVKTSKIVGFVELDPSTPSPSDEPATFTSPRLRKLHKFSSTFGLNVFGKGGKRQTSLGSPVSEDLEAVKEPEAVQVPSKLPQPPKPTRSASLRPRMIPRGASERAAPPVLPSCPKDYDNDTTFAAVTSWPARKESAARPRIHDRQRSVSAAKVTAEA